MKKTSPKNGIMTRSCQIKVKDMACWTESVAKSKLIYIGILLKQIIAEIRPFIFLVI